MWSCKLVCLTPSEPLGFVPAPVFAEPDRLGLVNSEGRVFTWDLAALRRELAATGLDWAESGRK